MSTRGLAQFTPLATSNCCSLSLFVFVFSSELVSLYSQLLGNHRILMLAILNEKGVRRC